MTEREVVTCVLGGSSHRDGHFFLPQQRNLIGQKSHTRKLRYFSSHSTMEQNECDRGGGLLEYRQFGVVSDRATDVGDEAISGTPVLSSCNKRAQTPDGLQSDKSTFPGTSSV